jgi:hypothetical protein
MHASSSRPRCDTRSVWEASQKAKVVRSMIVAGTGRIHFSPLLLSAIADATRDPPLTSEHHASYEPGA